MISASHPDHCDQTTCGRGASQRFAPGAALPQFICLLILLAGLFGSMPASADEIRPALLDIKEQNTGLFAVTWKIPTRGNRALAITPQLPASLELLGSPTLQDVPGALIEQATYKNNGESLAGQTIVIDGLSALQTDVLLLVQLQDGTQHSAILRPASPEFTIPLQASKLKVAADYWRMGTIHILEGIDHLLFVLALMLIVSGFGPLLKAVTAFTVAHSITLALATLGVVHVPSAPTEAIIALSILFLAAEIVHQREGVVGLTERYPWLIAFLFGLFHGLGFAGGKEENGHNDQQQGDDQAGLCRRVRQGYLGRRGDDDRKGRSSAPRRKGGAVRRGGFRIYRQQGGLKPDQPQPKGV